MSYPRIHRWTRRDGVRTVEGGSESYRGDDPGPNSGRRELAGGLQALLGAPMAAYSGCGERKGTPFISPGPPSRPAGTSLDPFSGTLRCKAFPIRGAGGFGKAQFRLAEPAGRRLRPSFCHGPGYCHKVLPVLRIPLKRPSHLRYWLHDVTGVPPLFAMWLW